MSQHSFEYIVIGAGTAGCIVANRLSADPRNRVLLLEAGGKDTNPWIHIPVGYFRTMHNPKTDWCYKTELDPGLNGRSISWPRGKVLGGSSSINGLIYIRGQKEDYDDWQQLGNLGWSYEDMLPYFIKCEDQERGANDYHGVGGNLKVSDMRTHRKICDAFIDGAGEIGIPENNDFNGEKQEGAGYYQLTAHKGRRCSTAVGYLHPVKKRANLKIEIQSLVKQIRFVTGRAEAVVYSVGGKTRVATCKGEIILCAGAINSPQILMLSGIGDGEILNDFSIPVVKHLPGVGQNLQDHLQLRSVYQCNISTVNDEVRHPLKKMLVGMRYVFFRTGPMSTAASEVGVFAKTPMAREDRPDVQFHFQPLSADSPGEGVHDFSGVTSSVTQLRPESKGSIQLKSADPFEYPEIHPNYLSEELDQQVAVAALRMSRAIVQSNSMSSFVVEERVPGSRYQTNEELLDCARNIGETIYHPTGTCKMGPKSDPFSVVSRRLRVRGVARLRVVDASIMPVICSGNTNAPTAAIAEKASDMILADQQNLARE